MAARVQALCAAVRDDWHGDATAIWTAGDPDGAEILRRLKTLPGFGEQKARIFLAMLGKQRGLSAEGWRQASAPYGEDGSRMSVADIVDAESLARVRESKKAAKAAAKAEVGCTRGHADRVRGGHHDRETTSPFQRSPSKRRRRGSGHVITDPKSMREFFFGSEVVTDWTVGGPIIWRGEWEGKPYEDKGEIVAFEPGRRLVTTHFSPLTGQPDVPENYHTLTWTLEPSRHPDRADTVAGQQRQPGGSRALEGHVGHPPRHRQGPRRGQLAGRLLGRGLAA